MNKSYLSIDFSTNNYSDKDLNVKATTIIDDLTGNEVYAELAPDVEVLKSKNDLLGSYLSKVADGNKQLTSEKKAARKDLEDFLHTIGSKVQYISGGVESLILSSGFDLKRKGAPIGILDKPSNLRVKQGVQSGSLDVSWDVVTKAHLYLLRHTNAPSSSTSIWKEMHTTKHKTTVTGFAPGEAVAIQVTAMGTDANLVWSNEVVVYCMA